MKDDLKDILLGCVIAAIYTGARWIVDGFMKLLEEI